MRKSSKPSRHLRPRTKVYFNDKFQQDPKGTRWPAMVIEADGLIIECNGGDLVDSKGNVVARIVYSPEKVLKSDHYRIKAWIETNLEVRPR